MECNVLLLETSMVAEMYRDEGRVGLGLTMVVSRFNQFLLASSLHGRCAKAQTALNPDPLVREVVP